LYLAYYIRIIGKCHANQKEGKLRFENQQLKVKSLELARWYLKNYSRGVGFLRSQMPNAARWDNNTKVSH